jgi:cytochrome c nitrite reductase small subunit
MLMRKQKTQPASIPDDHTTPKKNRWMKFCFYVTLAVIVLAVFGISGGIVVHQSDVNPNFCAICHVMQPNVTSYMTGNTLDHVHQQANVQCKDCHDYPLQTELLTTINYVIGNYYMDGDKLPKRTFNDSMCLKCHISYEHIQQATDFLVRNPHLSHWDELPCSDCHISHGEQVDYCGQCHDNGGQRMVGGPIIPRAENPWANPNQAKPDTSGMGTPVPTTNP